MERLDRKEKFIQLAELIEQAGEKYSNYLLNPTDISIHTSITELETQGDVIEDQLNTYFTTQRNIPYLSLDRAKLLATLDEVLDQILLGSKTIEAFGASLPSEFQKDVERLAEDLKLITSRLAEAVIVIYDNFEEASAITKEIEEIRDDATSQVFQLEKSYFTKDDSEDSWRNFIAISRVTKRSMAIINASKSASEILQLMSMKYL